MSPRRPGPWSAVCSGTDILHAMFNFAEEPPLRGHDGEHDGQSRQTAPEGHYRDDAGDHPERGDNPNRGGDRVVADMVPADRDVPHVYLAGSCITH
jgi:hypothetical protein